MDNEEFNLLQVIAEIRLATRTEKVMLGELPMELRLIKAERDALHECLLRLVSLKESKERAMEEYKKQGFYDSSFFLKRNGYTTEKKIEAWDKARELLAAMPVRYITKDNQDE